MTCQPKAGLVFGPTCKRGEPAPLRYLGGVYGRVADGTQSGDVAGRREWKSHLDSRDPAE